MLPTLAARPSGRRLLAGLLALLAAAPLAGAPAPASPAPATVRQRPAAAARQPGLYEEVARILLRHHYDRRFRRQELPALVDRFRPAPDGDPRTQEEAIQHLLEHVPSSHTALYSQHTYDALFAALARRRRPTAGFQLVHLPEGWFATWVLEGGPAARAGLLRGDRVLAVDGRPPEASPRLDRRSDDAFLPDPPLHALLVEEGDVLRLELERRPGLRLGLEVPAAPWSAWDATRTGARVLKRAGRRLGYVHFWFMHMTGQDDWLARLLDRDFQSADGLLLDLRGRGGAAHMVELVLEVLEDHGAGSRLPVVALIDAGTRSAKEMLAWELRDRGLATLVGERTAGAVVPATFAPLDDSGLVLMYPSFSLGRYTELLEGRGVAPDVPAADRLPWAAGADPILEAGVAELLRQSRQARTPAATRSSR